MGENLMPVADALAAIIAEAAPGPRETVVADASLGHVLAEPVIAPADIPACDRSAMDGFALRAADVTRTPAELEVTGFLPAGRSAEGIDVGAGQAVRIMTGAPMPDGADAVQMVEQTEEAGAGRVRVLQPVAPGQHVLARGGDLRKGEILIGAGAWIRAAERGALAAAGIGTVTVVRRPSVGILSTGDELVAPEDAPAPHQVRNSNAPTLVALLRTFGIEAVTLGIARDERKDLDSKIARGVEADVLLLIGGVSVGDRDLVAARLRAAGVRVLFHRVAMKPGKPLLFGRKGGCLVFGLPGNPLSSLTDFLVFVLPAIRGLSGMPPTGLPEVRARLREEIRQKPGRTWYRLAHVRLREGVFEAIPVLSAGSGDLVSATRANAFAIVPAEASRLEPGSEVRVLLWPGFELG